MGPISGTETEGSDWSISCQRKRGSGSKHGAKTRSGGSHEQTERLLASHSRAAADLWDIQYGVDMFHTNGAHACLPMFTAAEF